MNENGFPRGGSRITSSKGKNSINVGASEDLFHTTNEPKPSQGLKTKRKKKQGVKDDDQDEFCIVEQLTPQKITEGFVLLACVSEVRQYHVLFSLPGGVTASMPITNMPDKYVELLQKLSEGPEEFTEELLPLSDIFQVGNCYPVKVTECGQFEGSSLRKITLSLNPRLINDHLTGSLVYHGMVLLGTIVSAEDHGYIIDIGIKGLTGFLSKKDSNETNLILAVGQILNLAVNMPELQSGPLESRNLALTCKPKMLRNVPETHENLTLQNILPGTFLPAEVTKIRNNGLVVTCLDYKGSIWKDNLEHAFQDPNEYKEGQEVLAMVLFIHPITQSVHMTLVSKPTAKNITSRFGQLKEGDLIKDAVISEVTPSGVYLTISEKFKGFASLSHLSDQEVESIKEKFQVAEKKKCRIIGFSILDKIVKVSLKKSIVTKSLIFDKNLNVGDIISGQISKHVHNGAFINFSTRVNGFVPSHHLSDIPLQHPERTYPIGTTIKCRILRIDPEHRSSHLLTCKKTLITSKIPPLTNLEDITEEQIVEGYVIKASSQGILVGFYNNLAGWVPSYEMSNEHIEHPEKVFFTGQVVKCKVLSVSPLENKMQLSLRLDSRKPFGMKDMGKEHDVSLGDILTVKIKSKNDTGFDVTNLPDGPDAFLPTLHLSDHPYISRLKHETLQVGDVLKKVVVFNTKGTLVVSANNMILQAAKGTMVKSFDTIQPGQFVTGVIKGFFDFGLLVDLGNGMTGLVHRSKLINGKGYIDPKSLGFVTGQSLSLKVLTVDAEHSKLSLSSCLSDVMSDYPCKESMKHLQSFLKDWSNLNTRMSENLQNDWRKLSIGLVVPARIEDISSENVLCELIGFTIKGYLNKKNIHFADPILLEVGQKWELVIVHLDFVQNMVELVLWPALSKSINGGFFPALKKPITFLQKKKFDARVVCITGHFALCIITKLLNPKGFVYLPLKRHPNDPIMIHYQIGEVISITLFKKYQKSMYLGFLAANSDLKLGNEIPGYSSSLNTRKRKQNENLQLGLLREKRIRLLKESDETLEEPGPLKVGDIVKGRIQARMFKKGLCIGFNVNLNSDITGTLKGKEYLKAKTLENGTKVIVELSNILQQQNDKTAVLSLLDPLPVKTKESTRILKRIESKDSSEPREQSKIEQELVAIVSKCYKRKCYVRVSDNVLGLLDPESTQNKLLDLSKGQNLKVKVHSVGRKGLGLTLLKILEEPPAKKLKPTHPANLLELSIGEVLYGTISHFTGSNKIFVRLNDGTVGVLETEGQIMNSSILPGTKVKVVVKGNLKKKLLLFSFKGVADTLKADLKSEGMNEICVGQTLVGVLSHYNDEKVFVRLNDGGYGYLNKTTLKDINLKIGMKLEVLVKANKGLQPELTLKGHTEETTLKIVNNEASLIPLNDSTISIGQVLHGVVTHFNNEKIFVKVNDKTYGFLNKDSLKKGVSLPIGTEVKVLLTEINGMQPKFSLKTIAKMPKDTSVNESDEKNPTPFIPLNDATILVGQLLDGVVTHFSTKKIFVRVNDTSYGFLNKNSLQGVSLPMGTKVKVLVTEISDKQPKFLLKSITEIPEENDEKQSENTDGGLFIGEVLQGMVSHSSTKKIYVQVHETKNGFLRKNSLNVTSLPNGTKVEVSVVGLKDNLPEFALNSIKEMPPKTTSKEKPQKVTGTKSSKQLFIGQILQGVVSHYNDRKVFVRLTDKTYGYLRKNRLSGVSLPLGTKLDVTIADLNSMQPELTLKTVIEIPTQTPSDKENDNDSKKPHNPNKEFKVDQVLSGVVSHCNEEKVFVRVKDNTYGFLNKDSLTDELPLGSKVQVFVADVRDMEPQFELMSVTEVPKAIQIELETDLEALDTTKMIEVNDVLTGTIQKQKKFSIVVNLGGDVLGVLQKRDLKQELTLGSKVQVLVTEIKHYPPKPSVAHLEFMQLLEEADSTLLSSEPDNFNVPITDDSSQKKAKQLSSSTVRLSLSEPFIWDEDAISKLEESRNVNEIEESDNSEDELDEQPTDNRKKTKASIEAKRKEQEERIRKQEERLMDLDREPETSDDYDRLLIASPDNSVIWMKYMAFQLQHAEVEKARAIAERALKTISFREEREKLNIWVALLNLENMYGSQDSLNGIFQRALQFNEPLDVYQHMVNIYSSSNKNQEAEQIYQTMLKKFRQNPNIWLDFGLFYMKTDQLDSARKLMDRSLKSLDTKHHIDIISKFGQLEFKFGDGERGKTLFKNILNSFPKRIDLWSVFIDLLIKQKDIDSARQALDKLASMNLPAKKMKFVFKKYLDFEKEYGTEDNIERVRLRALEYVQGSEK